MKASVDEVEEVEGYPLTVLACGRAGYTVLGLLYKYCPPPMT